MNVSLTTTDGETIIARQTEEVWQGSRTVTVIRFSDPEARYALTGEEGYTVICDYTLPHLHTRLEASDCLMLSRRVTLTAESSRLLAGTLR